ncbi:lactate racemase domain-containing protein [Thermodesulforhabdus norvegica]|uniref:Uncharacterized conserved protein, DUF362 family n=1 Tax=Thermodesulforhabdus norvegica TaxID=39841 RepID=A0A1I4R2P3_9BACT|nr:lactate racemase domain-containing protein [Thermodesulforhabdus norvegica]SFM46578.1 Uncharacterized conserved protein, DUF362 family [Thermodesulforhabdus norvegica]
MGYPEFRKVRQIFRSESIKDPVGELRRQLKSLDLHGRVRPGQSVAIGVGSRGVARIVDMVKEVVAFLKELGLKPYVTPAMGSHGAATAEGQADVLRNLGIKEDVVGAPIVASMDVVCLGELDSGARVYFARDALDADHLVVINRVKPHTAFRSDVESGLCKMLAVGLGRQKGASYMHKFQLGKTIVPAARLILSKVSVLFGVAVVENERHELYRLKVAGPEEFVDVDRALLLDAWEVFPRIPVDDLDTLIIDRMGKDISGAGMDPNVIGFWRREGGERKPDYRTVIVLDLTPASHGNATGIGMADIVPRRLIDKVDWNATYTNARTSRVLRSARMPLVVDSDKEAFELALDMVPDPHRIRMVRIKNTLELETFWATEPVVAELQGLPNIVVENRSFVPEFDEELRLIPFE